MDAQDYYAMLMMFLSGIAIGMGIRQLILEKGRMSEKRGK